MEGGQGCHQVSLEQKSPGLPTLSIRMSSHWHHAKSPGPNLLPGHSQKQSGGRDRGRRKSVVEMVGGWVGGWMDGRTGIGGWMGRQMGALVDEQRGGWMDE